MSRYLRPGWFIRFLSFLAFASLVNAQIGGGSIVGSVTDPSGAFVAGAKVTATNTATNEPHDTVSNEEGYFEFPLLPAGNYRLSVQKTGFRQATTAAFDLNTGTRPRFDLKLEVGDTGQSIEVVATAPIVNVTTTDLGQVMDTAKVEELPLNGRNFQQLVGLQAGANSSPASGNGGRGGVQFNGSTSWGNNLLLDGVDMSFGEVNGVPSDKSAGGGGLLINGISIEAIQEFKTTTSAFSAEFGRAVGGILNVTTKSGSNAFHGTLFEFFRNDKLDANSFFSNAAGLAKPPLRWNQFGGNLGGPIVRNRLFFFFNWESAQVIRASQVTGNVPTPALLSQVSAPIRSLFQSMFPSTYTPTSNPLIGFHRRNDAQNNDENTYLSRVDTNLGNHQLGFRYSYNHQDYTTPLLYPTLPRPFPLRFQNAVVQDGWSIKPSMFNELRLGFNRVNLNRYEAGRDKFPDWITVADVGLNASLPSFILFTTTTYTFADNLSIIHGHHTFKTGVEIRALRSARGQGGQPTYNYATVADLIAERPVSIQLLFGGGKGLHNTNYGFYFQDDWRVTPRLQLEMGLRYEYNPPLTGAFNIASNDIYGSYIPTNRQPMFAPDRNDFGPRLGIIWDPLGNQKFVFRAGGSISYLPQQPIFFYDMAFIDPRLPFVATISPSLIPGAPSTFPLDQSIVNNIVANPNLLPSNFILSRSVAEFNNRDTYAGNWNFSVQSAITPNLSVQLAYVGNRTLKITSSVPYNLVNPATGVRPVPSIGEIDVMENAANISYHSMQLSVNQRLKHGLRFDIYYTYATDTGYLDPDNANSFTNNGLGNPVDLRTSVGPVDSDIRHQFTGVFSYDIPTGAIAKKGFTRAVLGGWTSDAISTWRSGLPVNVTSGLDLYGNLRSTGQRPDDVVSIDPYIMNAQSLIWLNKAAFDNNAPRAQHRFGDLGYNALRGPSGFGFDAAVHKTFQITERQNVAFRFEMFNALNHKILSNPDSTLTSATFGRILSASGGRNIQLALKYRF